MSDGGFLVFNVGGDVLTFCKLGECPISPRRGVFSVGWFATAEAFGVEPEGQINLVIIMAVQITPTDFLILDIIAATVGAKKRMKAA